MGYTLSQKCSFLFEEWISQCFGLCMDTGFLHQSCLRLRWRNTKHEHKDRKGDTEQEGRKK